LPGPFALLCLVSFQEKFVQSLVFAFDHVLTTAYITTAAEPI
jgi:hypothetical protein